MTGKIYFASDFHLGLPAGSNPLDRERKIVRWLNGISNDAKEIYLLGDVFDFWWEYKLVVPKGFTRFLGTVATLTDSGIPVHLFAGNHDMWIGKYLSDECGIIIHSKPYITIFDNKKFYLAHGEGLGSRDPGYKLLLAIFRNRPLQVLYSALHPAIGVGFGHRWSLHSRLAKGISIEFAGEEKEDLIKYSKKVLQKEQIDYFIYGHRHLSRVFMLENGSVVTILGDWIKKGSYAMWNGKDLMLNDID